MINGEPIHITDSSGHSHVTSVIWTLTASPSPDTSTPRRDVGLAAVHSSMSFACRHYGRSNDVIIAVWPTILAHPNGNDKAPLLAIEFNFFARLMAFLWRNPCRSSTSRTSLAVNTHVIFVLKEWWTSCLLRCQWCLPCHHHCFPDLQFWNETNSLAVYIVINARIRTLLFDFTLHPVSFTTNINSHLYVQPIRDMNIGFCFSPFLSFTFAKCILTLSFWMVLMIWGDKTCG